MDKKTISKEMQFVASMKEEFMSKGISVFDTNVSLDEIKLLMQFKDLFETELDIKILIESTEDHETNAKPGCPAIRFK